MVWSQLRFSVPLWNLNIFYSNSCWNNWFDIRTSILASAMPYLPWIPRIYFIHTSQVPSRLKLSLYSVLPYPFAFFMFSKRNIGSFHSFERYPSPFIFYLDSLRTVLLVSLFTSGCICRWQNCWLYRRWKQNNHTARQTNDKPITGYTRSIMQIPSFIALQTSLPVTHPIN